MKRLCSFLSLSVAFAAVAAGQPSAPSFEKVDVQAEKSNAGDGGGFIGSGRAEFMQASMLQIIAQAYGVDEEKVAGGPSWLASSKFHISAAAKPDTPDAAVREMLQALLADRFKLEVHKDTRDLPVFELTVAKGGPKLKPAVGSPSPGCDRSRGASGPMAIWVCRNMTLTALTDLLGHVVGGYIDHPLLDATELKGAYDFDLTFTKRAQLGRAAGANGDAPQDITLAEALEKQLGLQLTLQKRPAAVIVVDRVNEKPSGAGSSSPPGAEPTQFEVASIHPSPPSETGSTGRVLQGGQVELRGITLQDLITIAYKVEDDRISGAPPWLGTDKFDILAKAPPQTEVDALLPMLRSLVEERFQLKTHTEDRPVPVYALTQGSRAPKLKESTGADRSDCKAGAGDGVRLLTCQNTTMAQLAARLQDTAPAYLDHPVVDLTGLKGAYDFVLSWAPKNRIVAASQGAAGQADANGLPTPNATGDLTIFEAVDKQLGLKLAASKQPMPVLVIEHVERTPTEN